MLSKNKLKEGRCCLNNDYFQFKSTEVGGGSHKNCFSSYFCQSSPSDALWNSSLKVFSFVCICWSWFSKINSKYQTSLTIFRFLVALATLCLGFWGCCFFFFSHYRPWVPSEHRLWVIFHTSHTYNRSSVYS